MMDRDPMAMAPEAMRQIRQGAFLTVQSGERLNTMTIGWTLIGILWQRPMLMVAVRDSRHTFQLIENAADFTVTFPLEDMKRQLSVCGTQSGAKIDKFRECNLRTAKSRSVQSPIIQAQGIHYECRIVYRSAMNPAMLDKNLENLYRAGDYHTLYFGEITNCYETLASQ